MICATWHECGKKMNRNRCVKLGHMSSWKKSSYKEYAMINYYSLATLIHFVSLPMNHNRTNDKWAKMKLKGHTLLFHYTQATIHFVALTLLIEVLVLVLHSLSVNLNHTQLNIIDKFQLPHVMETK